MADNPLYKTQRWRNLRKLQLSREPLCRFCLARGILTAAKVADHIEPHRNDPEKFWGGELASLCKPCHSADKQFQENKGFRRDVGLDGWPIDPNHFAYGGRRGA